MVVAWLVLLALLVVERVFELVLSRRNARIMTSRGAVEVGHAHFRVMAVVHALFLVACLAEPLFLDRPFQPALFALCLCLAALAQALRWWAIVTLGERWNVRILVLPDAPPVTAGPYRFLRHPNYLAVIVELAAVPLIHGAWLTALVFSLANVALLTVRIRAEERALGVPWQTAFADRPRLVPRSPAHDH